jgi:hypothetical protein
MNDDLDVHLEDLAHDEIQELLAESGLELAPDQIAQLAQFIAQAGGLEEARLVLDQLRAAMAA